MAASQAVYGGSIPLTRLKSMQRNILVMLFCILCITGCATEPVSVMSPVTEGPAGIYHRVQKGETLWRISKMYSVDLDELIKANRISDATSIEVGQRILIPERYSHKRIPAAGQDFSDDFIWPLEGKTISGFGQNFNNIINKGINIQPYSSKDVFASRSGKVIFYDNSFLGYGKTIIIEHGDGFSTVYARNSEVFVKPGDSVQKGALIARAGSAGRDKNIYLHFEIRKGPASQNPYFYLPH